MVAPGKQLKHIEVLNQLGEQFDIGIVSRASYSDIAKQIRRIIGVDCVSLWRVDDAHQLLLLEALDAAPSVSFSDADQHADEKLTHWQLQRRELRVMPRGDAALAEVGLDRSGPWNVTSMPFSSLNGDLLGVLNFYTVDDAHWCFGAADDFDRTEFFRAVAGQMSLFIYSRALEANRTFYKEIHHRVKNNLQTVASLLRMQMRRLDRVSAERAIEESINRILSIALVHETLSRGEIGMVDLSSLVQRICTTLTQDQIIKPRVKVDIGEEVRISSKDATSLALVVNELLQNAMHHGLRDCEGDIVLSVTASDGGYILTVSDNGVGLPAGFDLKRDSNMGLTIVATLVAEELAGSFNIIANKAGGTEASVRFTPCARSQPLPA